MDKHTITGILLIILLFVGFTWWNQPSEDEIKAQQEQIAKQKADKEKKSNNVEKTKKDQKILQSSISDTTALFHKCLVGTPRNITLKNKYIELTFNTKGATVEKVLIKNYKDNINNKKGVVLFDKKDQSLNYTLVAKEANISTQDLYFEVSKQTDSTLVFTAEAAEGKNIVLSYNLGKDYMLHMSLITNGMEGFFAPNTKTLDIDWQEKCRQQEKGFNFENRYATLTYHNCEGGTDQLSETSEKTDKPIEEQIDWVAFKNQFFSSVMIAKSDFQPNALMTSIPFDKQNGKGYLKSYQAKMKSFFDPTGKQPSEFEFYYGPNDFRLLQQVEEQSTFGKNLQLQRLVYLGWPLFRIINRWFTIYVFDWLSEIFPMGVVLILITLLLKIITYPMVKKSYMSSAKMRVLKPKLEAATAKFDKPEDQMQKQQAMMAEYSKYGVSPLSGCLPMLIQTPIWIAMFNFVPNAIQLRGQSFLWMNDLSTYDPIVKWSTNLPLVGDHLSLTCILFCVANLLYSWMTMRQQRDQMVGQQAEQMKMMQWMMFLMPLMFFFIFNDYSAGLNFYYFVSLFFSAAIMWTLRKTTNDEKLLSILEARYKENQNNPQKMKGLAARLQAMQEQQAQLQRQREELARKRKKY